MKRKIATVVLLIIDFIILLIARCFTDFANYYSTRIFPFWVNTLGRLSNIVSFSLVEILLYLCIFVILLWFILFLWKIRSSPSKCVAYFKNGMLNLFFISSILFTFYTFTCGINYQRDSFATLYNYETDNYTEEELLSACTYLTQRVNQYAGAVDRTNSNITKRNQSISSESQIAMKQLGSEYALLSGYYPAPKPLWFSSILSVQGLTGIYSPFTIEANYNQDMTDYNIPFTTCHELAHLKGFMQENEANFIAYLACISSTNPDFQYSGYLMGWIYCTNELYQLNIEAYQQIHNQLNSQSILDLQENTAFWDHYEGNLSSASRKINDTYLKANGHADGITSYNKIVDLIITSMAEK
ncbi:DUF3810 domain-containing protein [Lachnospiraceae bacterium LCP25S3_G4]